MKDINISHSKDNSLYRKLPYISMIAFFITMIGLTTYSYAIAQTEIITRKEYVYCPIDVDTLDNSIVYEINGCPTVRMYVENYDRLDTLTRTNIDVTLKARGFEEKENFKIDELTGRVITEVIAK